VILLKKLKAKKVTSKIFTVAEIEAIEKRERGDKTDTTGIFYGRAKPKIEEILNQWVPKKKKLQKLIASSSHKNNKKEGRHSSQD
jgi:hypothetical protein